MNKAILEKLAEGVMALRSENETLKQENASLIEKVASFEDRERAENVLVEARSKGGAPSALITRSIEDFLEKRAALQRRGSQEIEKLATILEYIDNVDDISLSDDEERSYSADPLTDWLAGMQ